MLKILVSYFEAQHNLHSSQDGIHTKVTGKEDLPSLFIRVIKGLDGLISGKVSLLFPQHISLSFRNRDIPRNNVLPSVVAPLAQSDPQINQILRSPNCKFSEYLIAVVGWLKAQE